MPPIGIRIGSSTCRAPPSGSRAAGYPNGIDPATGRPLRLTLDVNDTSARALLMFQFFRDSWKRLGLDVEITATDYNAFQDKMRTGAYQVFWWGWGADYPDPENFLFLLYGPMGRTRSGGPNDANFADPRYDELFVRMRARENDAERAGAHRRHARHPRARAPVDRDLSPRGLPAQPALVAACQAVGADAPDREVPRRRSRRAGAAARGLERAGALAGVRAARRRRRVRRPGLRRAWREGRR